MTTTLARAGSELSRDAWHDVRKRAIFDFCKWDVQCEDHSVLASFPLLLERETARYLNEAAEALAREAMAAEAELLGRPDLIKRLGLPRALRRVLERSGRKKEAMRDLRVMRFDFHPTPEGWRISEVNADVPGGFVEASGWNSLLARHYPGTSAPPVTSEVYASAVHEIVGSEALVAFVHATAYSDDRQVMQHLARCFSKRGMHSCLLSPAHLFWKDGSAEICANFASGQPNVIVRFFPAEWLPNLSSEECWRPYFEETNTLISNPGYAILLQTKRFPLIWDELRTDLSTWRSLLPETREVTELIGKLDDSWVLKPVLGRVGEGIGILGITSSEDFQKLLGNAKRNPQEWIAQKRFAISPVLTERGAKYPCIGVFTIGGKAAGFYGRISDTPIITQDAQDIAILILDGSKGAAI